jgi:Rrf2 family protein
MILNVTSKTAIKAVIYLASKSANSERVGIREIAEKINASEHTIGKTLQTLVKQGIINSTKGPNGGFYMEEKQLKLPISVIVETIEGPIFFEGCGLGLSKCSATHPCPIHDEYKVVRDLVSKIFKEKRIKDLCDPVSNGLAYLIG